MTSHGDEDGVFQIVEAILVAVLVATTLIFFALVSRPPAGTSSEGQDLAILAGDALDILQAGGGLDQLASDVSSDPNAVRAAITPLLPTGLLYEVRADCDPSGATAPPSVTGPGTTVVTPRNAQAAAAYADDGSGLCLIELVVWNGF